MQESHFKNIDFFYAESSNITESGLKIVGEDFNHLTKSLRKWVNDQINVIDGSGFIYTCRIANFAKSAVECTILDKTFSENEHTLRVDLAAALLKNPARFDLIIEKTTEIGINKIIPFRSEFTISNTFKKERWKQIAISAMKQSQRALLPLIEDLKTIDEVLKYEYDLKLIADRESGEILFDSDLANKRNILIMIGPEGGFSETEIKIAEKSGFKKINIGKTRLRSETAAIVFVSRLLTP